MARFQLFGAGITSKSRKVTAQRRVNVYYQFEEQEEDNTKVTIYGTPGLDAFCSTLGATGCRGLIAPEKSAVMYAVNKATLFEINAAGASTARGTLEGSTGRCYLSENGAQLFIVDPTDGGKGYTYTIATTTLAKVVDADYPGLGSVDFLDGFFVGPKLDSGRWYKSASYDGANWVATDFTNAEASPDNSKFLRVANQQALVFGENTTEFFSNTGVAGFPFQSIRGTTIQWGLAANASCVLSGNNVFALMKSKDGQPRAVKIVGYQDQRVSNDAIEQIWQRYSGYSDATGFSYMMDGHVFYQLNFPSAGVSWLFDDNTGMWFQRETSGARHLADQAVAFNGNIIVADYSSGNLYKLKPDVYTDNGATIRRLLVSRHVYQDNDRLSVPELEFLFDTGVGLTSGQGVAPEAMLRISRDGGNTYGPIRRQSLGAMGNYRARCQFDRNGQARDFVFELSVSDPVKFALIGERIKVVNDTQAAQRSRRAA